jgi:hypothetical protein
MVARTLPPLLFKRVFFMTAARYWECGCQRCL